MKLLDWVHRKFRQNGDNNANVIKDYNGGGTSFNCLCPRLPPEENQLWRHRRSTGCHGFTEAEYAQSHRDALLFEGLFSIGTLGSAPFEPTEEDIASEAFEPATVETIAEKLPEVVATEAELMLVGAELEKVLLAEAEKEGPERVSSARPSQARLKGVTASACPLQEFLLGSSVEVADTVGRKEGRASLGELFKMTKEEEEEQGRKVADKEVENGGMKPNFGIKLLMMKKKLQDCQNSGSCRGPDDTSVISTKFNKILKIFHKKVHPENNMTQRKSKRSQKNKISEKLSPSYEGNDSVRDSGDGLISETCSEESIQSFNSHSIGGVSSSDGSHEYWIRTDSDYLVLEL